ncbi:MAG: hypothetical protein K1X78_24155 [Verrucomicrobiaceae bacterium]|nr:hypothetical protein [Verrucomicrobiaceae bacterium]
MNRSRFLIAAFLIVAAKAGAQQTIINEVFDKDDGTKVEVRAVFDPSPPSGCAPVRVVATNGSARDLTWSFEFISGTTAFRRNNESRSNFELKTPPHATGSATFIVPVAVNYGETGSYRYNQHNFRLSAWTNAHGVKMGTEFKSRVVNFPAIAISKSLADANLTKLNDEVRRKSSSSGRGSSSEIFGSSFNPDDLPADWLAFSGFDYVMLSAADWETMKTGVRLALIQWVRFGGQLHVYVTKDSTELTDLPCEPPGVHGPKTRWSLGEVMKYSWNGSSLDASTVVGRYDRGTQREDMLTSHYASGSTWGLLKALGGRSFASWQVLVFLFIFGMLVGPVNLFVLAPAGRRHRLFYTTPLLSVGASALMIVFILFQDGTGGTGRRFTVINVEPGETTGYVTQEQVSRAGMLFSSGFDLAPSAIIEPLALPDTGWTKLKSGNESQATNLVMQGAKRSGNFFQSRTEQAHVIRSAVSTRARVELKSGGAPDAPPSLISALGFTVEELFYIDDAGKTWKAEAALATGQAATMEPMDDSTARANWEKATSLAGAELKNGLKNNALTRKGVFFATAKSAPGFTQETLSSIRWKDDHVVVFGSVAKP